MDQNFIVCLQEGTNLLWSHDIPQIVSSSLDNNARTNLGKIGGEVRGQLVGETVSAYGDKESIPE
jgi:hypothetical protein